jgi:hypothetical protein
MFEKNQVNVHKYTWEIDGNKASNVITGTLPIFTIDAGVVIKKVTARVRQLVSGYSAQVAAYTAVNATTNIITKSAHGFNTGTIVQVSTSDTLPTGISASTDYWVIYLSSSTFALAETEAKAFAGTKLDITAAGAGNHTFTPTALTCEVGDGDDADGYLKATFAEATGYVGSSYNDALMGDYMVATGVALEKYYSAADTVDFKITGQAKQGKIDFYIEYLGL